MRVINLLSAVALGKIPEELMAPFGTMDLHHILDKQISQDAIIDQMDNDPLSFALSTGNIYPLWDTAEPGTALYHNFTTGWIERFFLAPFDPICVMLAMRVRLLLDLIDELGHSYNLLRFFPAEIWEPIDPVPPGPEPIPPGPEPIPPGPEPIPPGPEPIPPGPEPPPWWDIKPDPIGIPGRTFPRMPTLGPDGPGLYDPGPEPGDDDGPGDEDGPAIDIFDGPGADWDGFGGGPGGGSPWGGGYSPGPDGGGSAGGGGQTFTSGDPCADKYDPSETVKIGYTTQGMQVNEQQTLTVEGYHPRWAPHNYKWQIAAGGGTLSAESGYSVVYTAPATNPECINNATIELVCEGDVVDTLQIAINASEDASWAVRVWSDLRCVEVVPDMIYNCYLINRTYNCAGELMSGYPCELQRQAGGCGACYDDWSPSACYSGSNTMVALLAASPIDLRTAGMITDGCCPEQLLL
jgi:hypothetical protein